MKNPRLGKCKKIKDNITRDVKNLFRLKKEIDDTAIKDVRNLFRLKKENKAIKNKIIRDIRNLPGYEEKDYYKPVSVGNFWSNNYIEYESNNDRNKTVSVEDYLNKVRPYLEDIINNPKKSDMWKIQITIAINFVSSKNNDEEHVMHSKSDDIEIMINGKDKVFEKRFKSLLHRYHIELETSMRGSDFIFDCVHLL